MVFVMVKRGFYSAEIRDYTCAPSRIRLDFKAHPPKIEHGIQRSYKDSRGVKSFRLITHLYDFRYTFSDDVVKLQGNIDAGQNVFGYAHHEGLGSSKQVNRIRAGLPCDAS